MDPLVVFARLAYDPRMLRACALLAAAIAIASTSGVGAQTRQGPVVLVIDPGHVRVSADALRDSLARDLGRDVVRITDERARDGTGTLTIASDGPTYWLVRFEARGRAAQVRERIARPGTLNASLSAVAARVMGEVENEATPAEHERSRTDRNDFALYIAWVDEILDPFVGVPAPPRREMAIYSEVIDPFAPVATRRTAWTEVLDPWDR